MRIYQPSHKVPLRGLLILVATALLASLLLGALAFLLKQIGFYIVYFMPLLLGGVGGLSIAIGVRQGKVRNIPVAIIFGLLTGTGIVLMSHFADYRINFLPAARADYLLSNPDATQEEINAAIDRLLVSETGLGGFFGYLKFAAQQGMVLRSSLSFSENRVDEFGTWVRWGIDWLIITAICMYLAFRAAKAEFNEQTNTWYNQRKWLGSVPLASQNGFMERLKAGNFVGAGQMMGRPTTVPFPRLDIMYSQDKGAPDDILLVVEAHEQVGTKTSVKIIMRGTLSQAELDSLGASVAVRGHVPAADDGEEKALRS